jgi:hypothetical protein
MTDDTAIELKRCNNCSKTTIHILCEKKRLCPTNEKHINDCNFFANDLFEVNHPDLYLTCDCRSSDQYGKVVSRGMTCRHWGASDGESLSNCFTLGAGVYLPASFYKISQRYENIGKAKMKLCPVIIVLVLIIFNILKSLNIINTDVVSMWYSPIILGVLIYMFIITFFVGYKIENRREHLYRASFEKQNLLYRKSKAIKKELLRNIGKEKVMRQYSIRLNYYKHDSLCIRFPGHPSNNTYEFQTPIMTIYRETHSDKITNIVINNFSDKLSNNILMALPIELDFTIQDILDELSVHSITNFTE